MARAGQLRDRARFERAPSESADADDADYDDYGNPVGDWSELGTVWADLRETPGREAIKAGRVESGRSGTLRVRASTMTRAVTAADRVIVRGSTWDIRSGPVQIDRAGALVEFTIETGVAP